MMIAVVRIKGNVNVRKELKDTLKMLRLDAPNRCIVIKENPSQMGMIRKVRDLVTFGTIDIDVFTKMMEKRGRIEGDKRLDKRTVKETGYDSIETLAKDIFEGKISMKNVPKLKPVFRLTPPSKRFKSTKLHYPQGDLGDRKDSMKELIERMI